MGGQTPQDAPLTAVKVVFPQCTINIVNDSLMNYF